MSHEFNFTSWVQIYELRVQIDELRVQIDELRVHIHKLGVQIHELPVQIHELPVQINEFNNHLSMNGAQGFFQCKVSHKNIEYT